MLGNGADAVNTLLKRKVRISRLEASWPRRMMNVILSTVIAVRVLLRQVKVYFGLMRFGARNLYSYTNVNCLCGSLGSYWEHVIDLVGSFKS